MTLTADARAAIARIHRDVEDRVLTDPRYVIALDYVSEQYVARCATCGTDLVHGSDPVATAGTARRRIEDGPS